MALFVCNRREFELTLNQKLRFDEKMNMRRSMISRRSVLAGISAAAFMGPTRRVNAQSGPASSAAPKKGASC